MKCIIIFIGVLVSFCSSGKGFDNPANAFYFHFPTLQPFYLTQTSQNSKPTPPITSYPKDLEWIVNIPYKINRYNYDNQLSLEMGKALYNLSEQERAQKRATISQKTKEVFLNLYNEKADRIPHITHRIWITDTQNPHEASAEQLSLYLQSLEELSPDWEHHFWCMNPDSIPQTIHILKTSKAAIQIHKLEEIYPVMKGKHVFDAYYNDKQFCFASDIARQNIVYQMGGVYADLGTLFLTDLTPFVDAYDYIFWHNIRSAFFDQSFFGYKKQDPLFKKYLENLDTLYKMPNSVKEVTQTPRKKMGWHTPPHLMVLVDGFSKPEDRFLFVPQGDNSLITINHSGSWRGQERFGNKCVNQSTLDILSIEPRPNE